MEEIVYEILSEIGQKLPSSQAMLEERGYFELIDERLDELAGKNGGKTLHHGSERKNLLEIAALAITAVIVCEGIESVEQFKIAGRNKIWVQQI